MKLLSVISARSTWLFNLNEMNPRGLRLFPDLTDAITEAFDFDEQPDDAALTPGDDKAQPGIKFKNGRFETDDGIIRVSLELYDDGVIADTSVSTKVTNQFLQFAIDWAIDTFSLTFDPALIKGRIYGSEISAQLDSSLSEALAPLGKFSDLLSRASFSKQPEAYFPSGVTFNSFSGVGPFTIERRTNTTPAANVFYSKCMTDTESHIELIQRFDEILGNG